MGFINFHKLDRKPSNACFSGASKRSKFWRELRYCLIKSAGLRALPPCINCCGSAGPTEETCGIQPHGRPLLHAITRSNVVQEEL
jgi:hypothetical protein